MGKNINIITEKNHIRKKIYIIPFFLKLQQKLETNNSLSVVNLVIKGGYDWWVFLQSLCTISILVFNILNLAPSLTDTYFTGAWESTLAYW